MSLEFWPEFPFRLFEPEPVEPKQTVEEAHAQLVKKQARKDRRLHRNLVNFMRGGFVFKEPRDGAGKS